MSTSPIEIAPSILSADSLRLGALVPEALDAASSSLLVKIASA